MIDYGIYEDIGYLKEKLNKLENITINMELIFLQICIQIGWSDEEIKNVIGAFDSELKFFRENIKK